MNIDANTTPKLDGLQPAAGVDSNTKSAPDAAATGDANFATLLESLQRLRQTGEHAKLDQLDSGLRAADSLQNSARELQDRLRAAFRERMQS